MDTKGDTNSAREIPDEAALDPADTALFLHSIVENIPDMIFVKDARDLRFVRFNRAGEELLGYSRSELLGKTDYDFFPRAEADFFTQKDREVLAQDQVIEIPEERIQTRHKGERILRTLKIPLRNGDGEPQYLLGISEDITERKHAEDQLKAEEERKREILARTDRLNTIGLLAAGMAHEINNPLQGMMSHLAQLRTNMSGNSEALASLQMIDKGIQSISGLVNRLLTLGQPQDHRQKTGALCKDAIDFVTKLLESQFARAEIEINVRHRNECVGVYMDERELSQVLMNILMNARDAMPEGGTIDIEADHRDEGCVIRISDSGEGMTPETLQQIFTPFFTTKGSRGTGLGLVVAASMLREVNGSIEVESEPGQGSTFTLVIPLKETPP